jgi:predicted metal-dependent hydrolase
VSFETAQSFAQSKAGWIKKHLGKMEQLEQRANTLANSGPIDRLAAGKLLIDRLDLLAKKYGFTYNRVFIRNQKTRWGSCSTKNNINLNVNLVRLPPELIDYTILHELVHTRVKNHSRKFWDQMDALLGDAKKIDKRLSAYEVLLI